MGLKLSTVFKPLVPRPLTLRWEDGREEILNTTHNPNAYTPEFANIIDAVHTGERYLDLMVKLICGVFVKWDLIDDEGVILGADRAGEVIPIEEEYVSRIPSEMLALICSALTQEHQAHPNPVAPETSGSFS